MKTIKYNQGVSTWIAIVIFAFVVIVGCVIYIYFSKFHSSQNPISTAVTAVVPENSCDYLTVSDLESVGTLMHQGSVQPSSAMCLYFFGTGMSQAPAGALQIITTNAPDMETQGNYQQALKIGAKPIQGIGDFAAEKELGTPGHVSVVIYFFKKGTIGALSLDVQKDQATAEVSTLAKNLTKLIVNKI